MNKNKKKAAERTGSATNKIMTNFKFTKTRVVCVSQAVIIFSGAVLIQKQHLKIKELSYTQQCVKDVADLENHRLQIFKRLEAKLKLIPTIPSDDLDAILGKKIKKGARVVASIRATNFVDYVKQCEGYSTQAYLDGIQWSIGWGTKAKSPQERITKKDAEIRLAKELKEHRKIVVDHLNFHNYELEAHQIDALTSFNYNTGSIKTLTQNGTRSVSKIKEMILKYVWADIDQDGTKEIEQGLVNRRNHELRLFNHGYESRDLASL